MTPHLAALHLLALLLAACGFGRVNGWAIGQQVTDCEGVGRGIDSCEELVATAATSVGLEAGTRGRVHREGSYGGNILTNRSGGTQYVVVLNAPSGERAVGVFCGIGDCHAGGQPAVRP
jgi:hypothetical protein